MASNSNSSSPLSDFAHTIFSYNTNIMLAALISLLLVVLFVLLLHAYANCFFPRRSPRRSNITVSYLLPPPPLHPLPFDSPAAPSKGLHPSLTSAIPLFVFESENNKSASAMECVICLTEFEDREIGRRLTKCGHGFHIDCIDMWLDSHANCPVCRAPVVADAAAESEGDIEDRNSCEIQRDNEEQNGQFRSSHSASSSSDDDPPLMSLVASLKRMMSRNRAEGRIFPSSNADQLDV